MISRRKYSNRQLNKGQNKLKRFQNFFQRSLKKDVKMSFPGQFVVSDSGSGLDLALVDQSNVALSAVFVDDVWKDVALNIDVTTSEGTNRAIRFLLV